MNIIFDFDGTIAKSTQYHRIGWGKTIKELGLKIDLTDLLPYEKNLKERFDSYRRIKRGFLEDKINYEVVSIYFGPEGEDVLAKKIMDLKESLTISTILEEEISVSLENLGLNLIEALNKLKTQGDSISIVSSSRETIIASYLHKCGLLDLFDYIWGEESLTDASGNLHDKPNPYFRKVLNKSKKTMDIYVGDNDVIDKEFAEVCGAKFIYANKNTDFTNLIENLEL